MITKDNLLSTLIELLKPIEEQCKRCDGSGMLYEGVEICWGCLDGVVTTTTHEQDTLLEMLRGAL